MSKQVKRYIVFYLGTLIFAFGISFGNFSMLGGNPMSIIVAGLNKHLPLSMGTCNLIVCIIQIIIGTFLDSSNTTIISVITMFIASYAIDFANLFIVETNLLWVRIIYMLAGVICYCVGIGIQQTCKVGLSNLDIFIFGFKKLFKVKEYYLIRWPVDIAFLVIGYLLGGKVGIGTIILLLFSGKIIDFSRKTIEKYQYK